VSNIEQPWIPGTGILVQEDHHLSRIMSRPARTRCAGHEQHIQAPSPCC
jgi:hypothetical protein